MKERHPLIEERKILVSAGGWDVFSSKLAERGGLQDHMMSFEAFREVVGLERKYAIDE